MIDFNLAASAQKAGKPLMTVGNRVLTYGEQWSRLRALKGWFQEHGLLDGKLILLAVADEFEQASLLLALVLLGKPPLIIDPGSTPLEAATILSNSTYMAVIGEKLLLDSWGQSDRGLPVLHVSARSAGKGVFGSLLKKRTTGQNSQDWPARVINETDPFENQLTPEALAYVVFTSGTTSVPKGVEISYSALSEQLSTLVGQYSLVGESRVLNTLPLHHVDGLIQGPFLSWVSGCSLFRPVGFSTQNLQRYMDSIYRDRITHLISVPTMLSLMDRLGQEWKENFEGEDFELIVSCAGHLEDHLWRRLESSFKVIVVNMYGLSETGTSALFSGPDDESRRVGTIGKPVNSQIRIVNEQGSEVEPGNVGELLISTPQLMRGYHNDGQATSAAIRDGWLCTGDLVRQLDSGHIEIAGRKKNQIISGGRNISPEEISTSINQHPGVIENVVFGQADPDWGEQVVAVAVTDNLGTNENELTDWCRSRLSEYKVPKHILVVNHLKKGPSGKIRIQEAKRLYEEQLIAATSSNNTSEDVASQILSLASATFRLPKSDLTIESTIENTPGWDSLGHLSLLLATEKTLAVHFSAREIMQVDSIVKLVSLCITRIQD